MAEEGSRTPASRRSSLENVSKIGAQDLGEGRAFPLTRAMDVSAALRDELEKKGLKGFKKGGKVKKTGPAMLHKGERVVPAKTVKKAEARRKSSDLALLKRTPFGR